MKNKLAGGSSASKDPTGWEEGIIRVATQVISTRSRQTPIPGRGPKVSKREVKTPNAWIAGVIAPWPARKAMREASHLQLWEICGSDIVRLPARQHCTSTAAPLHWIYVMSSGPLGVQLLGNRKNKNESSR